MKFIEIVLLRRLLLRRLDRACPFCFFHALQISKQACLPAWLTCIYLWCLTYRRKSPQVAMLFVVAKTIGKDESQVIDKLKLATVPPLI